MKNMIKKALVGGVMIAAASAVSADPINVGGVVWDPDSVGGGLSLADFAANGTLFESVTGGNGTPVTGFGIFDAINSTNSIQCLSCELTFVFEMNTQSFTNTGGNNFDFVFDDLMLNVYVDGGTIYDGTQVTAGDGVLWLSMELNGLLTGTGTDIGTGSDQGTGSGLLDVTGGIAADFFDTNTKLNGADFVFSSSFQPTVGSALPLSGTWELKGDSVKIPEPGMLALMGAGLLGFAAMRRRKTSV